jgi:cytosol alanyl aminopeptidase
MLHVLAVLGLVLAPPLDPAPPVLRLPGDVRPVRQSVDLDLDPGREPYSGTVEIDLDVVREAGVVWLNASGLSIRQALLGPKDAPRPARVVSGGDDFVGIAPERPLAPGPARLRIAFEGIASHRQQDGVFAMKEGEDWYLFTQFEPISARRAFPCFDEPAGKIPWRISLRVPHGLVALSNTPIATTETADGHDVVRYAESRPLPSYLVAFAVGPFDLVDIGATGRNRTPTRLAVPKGRAADTAWARSSTPRILELLEEYFDRPYPYEKLDQVAIPGVGFAMEHPGLVTYGMGLMVQRAEEETTGARRDWASVCAHELAHQWFGDLVTMAWWDDTWLNESFASWLGQKVTGRFQPDWGVRVESVEGRSNALETDSLATARRVRQPIVSKDDISSAFDGITYGKGEAVLEMVESWLGDEVFRRGVRAYLDRHAWGNATVADFLAALSAAASRDVSPVLSAFLDQTGAPLVSATVRCEGAPTLALEQRPYRALGSPAEAKTWSVPVCARVEGRADRACTLLTGRTGEVPLGTGACPGWSFANADAAGYYRTLTTTAVARRLLDSGKLTAAERVGLAGDLDAFVSSGDASAADAVSLIPLLAADPERHVVRASAAMVGGLERIVPDTALEPFRAWVRGVYGPRARTLGFSPRAGESEETRLLRRTVLSTATLVGRDPELEREAARLASGWLDASAPVPADVVDTVLAAAASDPTLFTRLRDEASRTADRERRQRVLSALGSTRDPGLAARALALTLDDRLDARESVGVLWALADRRDTARQAFDFLRENYDMLVSRLPSGLFSPAAYFPWAAARLCTPAAHREAEAFFRDRSAKLEGGTHALTQALEALDQCVARRQGQEASLADVFRSPTAGPR